MKNLIQLTFIVLVLAAMLPACNLSPAMNEPTAATSSQEPLIGLWMSETETLAFTKTSLYRVIARTDQEQVNEEFAEIIALDVINHHITLRTQWIKVNGRSVGFDFPTYTLTYQINGNTLQIGRGTDTEFVTELDPLIYQRK